MPGCLPATRRFSTATVVGIQARSNWARQMAGAFGAPLFASTTTRLLIDLNRTIGHRQLHSEIGRGLTRAQRQQVVAEHYRPHRDAVESEIARRVAGKEAVIHIASHSFTPVFGGIVQTCRCGLAIRSAPTWRNAAGAALAGRIGATCAWPAFATQLPIPGPQRRPRFAVAQAASGRGLCRHRARSQPALRAARWGALGNVALGPCRVTRSRTVHATAAPLGVRLSRARRYHCSAGSSWNTLRVPAIHCCLSDSK